MRDWTRSFLLFGVFGLISAEIVGQTADQGAEDNGALEMQPQPGYWSTLGANETYCSELYRLLKDLTKPDPDLIVTRFPEIYSGVHLMDPLKDALKKLGLDDQLCPPASPMVSRGIPFYFRPFKLGKKAKHETPVYEGDEFSHLYLLTDGNDKVIGIHFVCLAPKSSQKPNTELFYFDFPLSKKRSSTLTRVRWEVENTSEILILKAWHVHIKDGGRCLEFSSWYLPRRLANFIRHVLEVKLGVVDRSPPATPDEEGNANDFKTDTFYYLSTAFQGEDKVLGVVPEGPVDRLELTARDNNRSRCWKIIPLGNGYYRLTIPARGDDMSLDIVNSGQGKGKLRLFKTGDFSGQLWRITPVPKRDGYYRLTTNMRGDAFSLDVVNEGENSKTVILAPSGDYSGQMWKVTEVPQSVSPEKR